MTNEEYPLLYSVVIASSTPGANTGFLQCAECGALLLKEISWGKRHQQWHHKFGNYTTAAQYKKEQLDAEEDALFERLGEIDKPTKFGTIVASGNQTFILMQHGWKITHGEAYIRWQQICEMGTPIVVFEPTDCEHKDTWFCRVLCPPPCSSMHHYCHDCGKPTEECKLEKVNDR